ncbi:hypothetical protein O181_078250 [Austropuccinia psidii MF-1]|uniref:Uncharacterized protein n=1 Tax=Austropuccinia psidii MF-1 TaxID=1389203 RepID=A0A9Q3FJE6_9BASI|nr:hypothetical protein [Austropuccinia psidii MF-1]
MTLCLCTCSSCSQYKIITTNGNIQNGLLVDRSTRNRHWKNSSNEAPETNILRLFPNIYLKKEDQSIMKEKEDVTEDGSDVGEASMTEPEILGMFFLIINNIKPIELL